METEIFLAFATDNRSELSNEHFGSAKYYLIYQVDGNRLRFVKEIANTTPEEETHGDPKKAEGIGMLMKKNSTYILVGKAMGPNITRMRKSFVPVISSISNISRLIKKIEAEKINEILKELKSNNEKNIVYIN